MVFSPFIRGLVGSVGNEGSETIIILPGINSSSVQHIINILNNGTTKVIGNYNEIIKKIKKDAKNLGLIIDLLEENDKVIERELAIPDSDEFTLEEGGRIDDLNIVDINTLSECIKTEVNETLERKPDVLKLEDKTSKLLYFCGICESSFVHKYKVLRCSTLHFMSEIKSKYSAMIQGKSCGLCNRKYSSNDSVARHIGEKHGVTNEIRIKRGLEPLNLKLKTDRELPEERKIYKGGVESGATISDLSMQNVSTVTNVIAKPTFPEESGSYESETLPANESEDMSTNIEPEDSFNIIRKVLLNQIPLKREPVEYNETETEDIKENGENLTCRKCSFIPTTKSNLVEHKRVDHSEQVYSCSECSFNGNSLYHLKRHIDSYHEGVKYSCNICEYSARRPDKLKYHIQSKHEGIFYPCNQCYYKASRKDHLKTRIQNVHSK